MLFRNRNLLYGGISIAGIALAASQGMAQDNAPAAGKSKPSVTLPSIEITTTKKAPKRKSAARPKRSPAPTAPPEPTPAEIAAAEEAAFEEAWRRIGNPTPTKALGNLPPAYPGGQVAIGGGLGLLGNRSFMETPFSQTSYTSKTIQDQQARTVGDVLANDPSVRSVLGASAGYGFDVFNIRGFYYENGDSALNGLYGMAPQYSTAPNFVERIEVLKGPSALLNGMPPAGAIGGSLNLVTKQAPDIPITQVTTSYASDGYFGTNLDVARRFGADKEFGIRFNGGYHAGDTNIDGQDSELGNAVLNLDYRGERVRLSADVGYQSQDINRPLRFINMPAALLTSVPPPPKAGSNYSAPWMYWRPTDTFAMVQGEVDITKFVTAYAAIGWHKSEIDYLYASPIIQNVNGDWAGRLGDGKDTYETWSGVAGVRTTFDTGPVNHKLNVSYSSIGRDYTSGISSPTPPFFVSNLYNPISQPKPTSFAPALATTSETNLSSVGIADTLSILNDRVQFTVGVRRQTAGQDSVTEIIPLGTSTVESTEDSVWSPAYALLVKPFENVSLYANYIEGLKVGRTVPSGGIYNNPGEVFPPFQTKQKEVGVKVDFGRISTTVAAFDIAQPSFVNVVTSTGTSLELDGEQRNRGVEVNVFGELTPSVRVLGGVAYIDGRLEKTAGGVNDGNKAQGVAEWNVNFGAEWDTPFVPGLTLTGRMIYTSGVYINAANTLSIPDWTRFDVGARYTFDSPWNGKPITIRFAVENVANENYYAGSYTADGIVSLGAPRTYLVSSTFNF